MGFLPKCSAFNARERPVHRRPATCHDRTLPDNLRETRNIQVRIEQVVLIMVDTQKDVEHMDQKI